MSREGARKLLDIWDFFDKNPRVRKYEGIERDDFPELIKTITGEKDLGAARGYLEKVAAGEVNETVPAKIVEDAKEGRIPEKKVESTKRAISEVEDWIKKLKAKTPEEVAERDVAAAKVIAVIKTTEEVPTEAAAPPVAGPAPAPTGAPTAAAPSAGGIPGFSIIIGKPPKVAAPVSLEKGIRKGIATAALLPFATAVSMGAQVVAKSDPENAAALKLLANKIGPLAFSRAESQFYAAGGSRKEFGSFAEALANVTTSPFIGRVSGFKKYGDLVDFISTGRVVSIVSGKIEGGIFLTPSADGTSLVYTPSVVGSLVAQTAQRVLGGLAARTLNSLIGGGAKAAAGTVAKAAVGKAAGAGLGTLFGSIIPVVGNAIGTFVGWISTEILGRFLSFFRKHKEAIFATILVGLGVVIGGPVGLGFFAFGGLLGLGALAGGVEPGIQTAGSFGGTILYGITHVVLPSIAVPLTVALVSIPLLVAFIYYVITTGAFVAPKQIGTGPSFNLPFSLTGPLPSGVPFGWPVRSPIIQGPNTTYTHAGAQAIDIIDPIGTPVKATSPGVAAVYDFGPFGKHVEVQGAAGEVSFTVRYAHLSVVLVGNGQTVEAEQTIGLVGNTGNSDTPHLHYEFKGLPMAPPFIPKAVPEGCLGIESCNVTTD